MKHLKFRFRYFQDLAGSIALPEDFEPEKVTLHIKPEGKSKSDAVEQVFDWQATGS